MRYIELVKIKSSLILLTLIFTVFFVSCEEKKENKCEPSCKDWETCVDSKCVEKNNITEKIDSFTLEGVDTTTVDILFVIDNSGSMMEEQEKVAQNISNFMSSLQLSASAGKTNYHIGLITTSIYDEVQTDKIDVKDNEDGRLLKFSNDQRYLTSESHNESVVDLLKARIETIGVGGAGIERGFDAIKRALTERVTDGTNAGFLRDEAKLMIILVSDEDDCSTGLRAFDSNAAPFPISRSRGKDCVEQSSLIPEADGLATDDLNVQNKLKPVSDYYNFLLNLKNNDTSKIGFATIVGPLNCWSGDINDMGQGAQTQDASVPFSFLNCSYSSDALSQTMYDANFNTCENNVTPVCSCSPESQGEQCNVIVDLLTTCFNDSEGRANKIPSISENACSQEYLNGKCEEGKHCELTQTGAKCVENTCSVTVLDGSCPINQYCNNGVCENKLPATYLEKHSLASPGKRYLELQKLVAAGNTKDSYKYSICLEDYKTPLSLIASNLVNDECVYKLQNKTDTPCELAIEIFEPEDTDKENGVRTNLNSPWTYLTNDGKTGEDLFNICKDNIDKAPSERIDITEFLEKDYCGDQLGGPKECFSILFPKELGECPIPGSSVNVYYGVIE